MSSCVEHSYLPSLTVGVGERHRIDINIIRLVMCLGEALWFVFSQCAFSIDSGSFAFQSLLILVP